MGKQINTKIALDCIIEAIANLRTATSGAMATYRRAVSKLDSDVYAPQYINQKRAEARTAARIALECADIAFRNEVSSAADDLRDFICYAVTRPINPEFLASIQAYRAFELGITPLEIQSFAELASECYPALRILQKVAEENGLRLSIPDIKELERDVESVLTIGQIPTLYLPEDYQEFAGEVLPKVECLPSNEMGISRGDGTPTVFDVTLRRQRVDHFEDEIKRMRERWSMSCVVLNDDEADSKDDATSVEADSENNEKSAEEVKQQKRREFAEKLEISEMLTPGEKLAQVMAAQEKRTTEIVEIYE